MSDAIKRRISAAVYLFGMLGGLYGCLQYFGAMFVAGANDSEQELRALTFALATPFLTCLAGIWLRLAAGCWLIFAACYYVYGMIVQRNYMIEVRHFDQPSIPQTILSSVFIVLPLLGFGLFFVITDLLKWPKLLGDEKMPAED